MKILVLCTPRTRSTVLLDTLSKHYKLENKGETLHFSIGKVQNTVKNPNLNEAYYNHFLTIFKKDVEINFQQNNFIAKLFPNMLVYSDHLLDDPNIYNVQMITNLKYYLNIHKYNKIFYLNRNITDTICSWYFADLTNYFNFKSFETLQEQLSKTTKFSIELNSDLKFFIYECSLLYQIKKYLINNKIEFTYLDFQDIPNFLSTNYPNVEPTTIDSKIDYSQLVLNYKELDEKCQKFYNQCIEATDKIIFK